MIKYAYYQTKIGCIELGYRQNILYSLQFVPPTKRTGERDVFSEAVYQQIQEYANGKRKQFDLSISLNGTPFQEKVWRALLCIPYGQTATYKDIAERIHHNKASRAVGAANNKNKLAIIVPCHRVIGANGSLVGYAGGLTMKEKLLELEKRWTITNQQ